MKNLRKQFCSTSLMKDTMLVHLIFFMDLVDLKVQISRHNVSFFLGISFLMFFIFYKSILDMVLVLSSIHV